MKNSIALLIALISSTVVSVSASAACSDQKIISTFQTTFDQAARKNPYDFKQVQSVKYQASLRSGKEVKLKVFFESGLYKNESLFDVDVYQAITTDLLDKSFWMISVEPKSCQILNAELWETADLK